MPICILLLDVKVVFVMLCKNCGLSKKESLIRKNALFNGTNLIAGKYHFLLLSKAALLGNYLTTTIPMMHLFCNGPACTRSKKAR